METSACLISELHHAQLQDIAHRRTESSKLKVEETQHFKTWMEAITFY